MTTSDTKWVRGMAVGVIASMAVGLAFFAWCASAMRDHEVKRTQESAAKQAAIAQLRASDAGPPHITVSVASCHAFAATMKRKAYVQLVCAATNPRDTLDGARVIGTFGSAGAPVERLYTDVALAANAHEEVIFRFEHPAGEAALPCACVVESLR